MGQEKVTPKELRDDADSRVLQAVAQGHSALSSIRAATSLTERVIDRSLQRLRRQKRIEFGGHGSSFADFRGWRVKEKRRSTSAPCPDCESGK